MTGTICHLPGEGVILILILILMSNNDSPPRGVSREWRFTVLLLLISSCDQNASSSFTSNKLITS